MFRHKFGRVASVAAALCVAACVGDSTSDAPTGLVGSSIQTSTVPDCEKGGHPNFRPPTFLTCGGTAEVKIVTADVAPEYRAAVATAVDRWNRHVFNGRHGLPTLLYRPNTSSPEISVKFVFGAGSKWCGTGSAGEFTLIQAVTEGRCPPPGGKQARVVADLVSVAMHELGEALGFDGPNFQEGTPIESCVFVIPWAPAPLNATPCEHERQIVYFAYGLRGSHSPDLSSFLADRIELDRTSYSVLYESTFRAHATATHPGAHPDDPRVPMTVGLDWSVDPTGFTTFVMKSNTFADLRGVYPGQTTLQVSAKPAGNVVWEETWPNDLAIVTVEPDPSLVASVSINPKRVWLSSSNPSELLTGIARDAAGNVVPGIQFNWSSADPAVAWVDPGPSETSAVTGCYIGGTRKTSIRATAVGTSVSGSALATVTDVAC